MKSVGGFRIYQSIFFEETFLPNMNKHIIYIKRINKYANIYKYIFVY